jgi:hypothetical protein
MMNGRKIAGLVGTTAILIQVQFHYWVYRWNFSINSAALGDADSSPFLPSIKYHGPPVVLCSKCTSSRPWTNNKNVTCSDLILSSFSDYPSLLRAQRNISTGIQECEPCHPRSCGADTEPADQLRFDDAAPRLIRTIDHVLPSIPADILGSNRQAVRSNRTTALVYNPTILGIPATATINISGAVYLANYRVTLFPGPRPADHAAIAILDKNLNVLRDVVVDVNALVTKYCTIPKKHRCPKFEDFRLFYFQDTLFWSHADLILPINISTSAPTSSDEVEFPLIHGTGLHISARAPFRRNLRGLPKGAKNLNFFEAANGDFYVEIWPVASRRIDLVQAHNITTWSFRTAAEYVLSESIASQVDPPSFSFRTGLYGWDQRALTGDRGTACCATLANVHYSDLTFKQTVLDSPYLNIGISHTKMRHKYDMTLGGSRYLSKLYAFSPTAPGKVVAVSGHFCLPASEAQSREVNITGYKCPKIHFASGIVDSVDNASNVIIAYGIDDALSRMIVVPKRDIAMRLFSVIPNYQN